MDRIATNKHYRRALQTNRYTTAVELRAALLTKRAELPRAEAVQPPDSPADIDAYLERSANARRSSRARDEAEQDLSIEIARCELTIQSLAANHNQILASLQRNLAAVMDVAAAIVQRLGQAHTADQIVASNNPEAMNA